MAAYVWTEPEKNHTILILAASIKAVPMVVNKNKMSLDGFKKNSVARRNLGREHFLNHEENLKKLEEPEVPKRKLIAEHSTDVLYYWQAPEFETFEQDKKWFMYMAFILVAIIAYSVYVNSLIMSITFILIGVVGYMYIDKEARILDFMITDDGVVAGKEIFTYDRIKSFWIFYEPEGVRVISLHIESYLTPYVHIPIHDEDPVKIREALLQNIEEIKQEHNIVDTLERLFRI